MKWITVNNAHDTRKTLYIGIVSDGIAQKVFDNKTGLGREVMMTKTSGELIAYDIQLDPNIIDDWMIEGCTMSISEMVECDAEIVRDIEAMNKQSRINLEGMQNEVS